VGNGNGHVSRPAGKLTFGFAARIEKLKGPMTLINALGIACREEPTIFVNFAGDGSERQKIAARVKALNVAGHYRYHGVYTHPEECRAFMESLDVFVMPSSTEGTPNSVVEAMACGKPVIASAVGGIPDMVGEDAGLLVTPGDAKELAAAMLRLARDGELRQKMGVAARERYCRLFSPEVVIPLMLETYRRVVNNGNAHTASGPVQMHPWAVCV
jgi:glycosyltransferase involved in cell wall biosynthesis